ncbi:MAG: EamA family transporter [Flavobacterium sp.]|nr:EamA family transporter [Flavobacterium sp.]
MLDFNTSLLLKIISSLFFLISGIVWKKILINGGKNYHYIFYRVIATLFFFLLIQFYLQYNEIENFDKSISVIDYKDWIVCVSVCLFSFWGLFFYTEALQNGRLSFIAPLIVISSAISFITSLLVYNEALSIAKYLSILLILTGLFLHQKEKLIAFKLSKELLFTLIFSVIWGISFVLYLIPIKKFGVLNFSMVLELCVFISCVGLLIFKEKRIIPPQLNIIELLFCLLMGFLVAGGSLLSNFTLTQFPVSLNILIGLLFELIVLAVGLYFFREKLNKKDWILIALATTGGFLLLF